MAIWLTMCLHELVVVVFFNRIYKRKLKSLPNSKLASVWVYSVFLSLFYMITFHLNQDGYLKYTFLIILTWSHCFHCVFSWPDCWRIWRSLKKLKAQRWNFCVAWRGRSSTWSSDTSTERRSCSRCGWRNILLFTACSAHDCSNVALSYNWPRMIKKYRDIQCIVFHCAVYHQGLIIVCSCIWFSINVNISALVQTRGRGVGRSKNDLLFLFFTT